MKTDIDPALDPFVNAVLGKKAQHIVLLNVRSLTTVADAFLICSGRSNRQVTALAEHIRTDLKNHGIQPIHVEGIKEGHWVLLDYGHVIVHIFYEPVREFYDLEGLWMDAEQIAIEDLPPEAPS